MFLRRFQRTMIWSCTLTAAPLFSQLPVGSEFAVSTIAAASTQHSAVETALDGSFVVVWYSSQSTGGDASGSSILGRRFAADGTPFGPPFQVNSQTTGNQVSPTVAIDDDGEFVIAWSSATSPGDDIGSYSVQGQRYDSAGNSIGGQFQLNSYTTGRQDAPRAAYLPSGDFVVAWQSAGSAGSDAAPSYSIQLRRFDGSGTPVAPEQQVNSFTTGNQQVPTVGVDATGAYVVVWGGTASPAPGETFGVVARRFDGNGSPLGDDFAVNSYTTGGQFDADIATRADGSFVIGWTSGGSFGTDTASYSIQGRAFDAAGAPLAPEFQINSFTTSTQNNASLELDSAGGFIVAWQSLGSGGPDNQQLSVQARAFNSLATAGAPDFQVNTTTSGEQRQPHVGANAQGELVIVWEDDPVGLRGSGPVAIRGQRFRSGLFADGFESQGLGAWSLSVP